MAALVVESPAGGEALQAVARACEHEAVAALPPLVAGLWLYVDELDRSHLVSQGIEDPTGSFWHGIMHRREGEFSNSHYWFRRTGAHPAMEAIEPAASGLGGSGGYDPHALIDAVAEAHRAGEQPQELIELQRREWAALMSWSARHWHA